ncbi:MAG: hypothetical protein AAFQ94_05835 [Bacteroidota bacterium]
MKKDFLLLIALFFTFSVQSSAQNKELLPGKWDLIYFSAIDKIESSVAMQMADSATHDQFQKSKQMILDDFFYNFYANGTIKYNDISNLELVSREAIWTVDENILTITEFKRPYERQAKIINLSERFLELSLMIDGEVSPGSLLRFKRIKSD